MPDDPNFRNISVMSLALLMKSRDDAVAWRGPKKSTMIKQFLSQVVWGDLDYLIIGIDPSYLKLSVFGKILSIFEKKTFFLNLHSLN